MTNDPDALAARFEAHRDHLKSVAYRMLGSLSEADDAVQEAWLRLSRDGAEEVGNLGGWLTTVVARVCLDVLRSRKARSELPLGDGEAAVLGPDERPDPEQEAVLADSVGLALLVVLETLAPPERLAFVLHDLFGVSFDEIAGIVGRTPEAARQLASRARRRVQGKPAVSDEDLVRQRRVVEDMITAIRTGDMPALLSLLDPELVVRVDTGPGQFHELRGRDTWARGAAGYAHLSRFTRAALLDGRVGAILAPGGKLQRALLVEFAGDVIVRMEVVIDAGRLRLLDVAVL